MNFIKQYIKIINYSLMGMVFAFSGFYLLSNAYHYLEIRKDFVTDFKTQPLVIKVDEKMNKVKENIDSFNASSYRGKISTNQMMLIQQNLKGCISSFNNETIQDMKVKDRISIIDVYNLRESYENSVLSDCIVNGLHWTTTIEKDDYNSTYLLNNKEMMKLYVDSLINGETSYLKKDLLNNSSYYFNTSIASSSVKDNTKDGFYEVMGAYNRAASFVEFVSEWFKNEVEGNYD